MNRRMMMRNLEIRASNDDGKNLHIEGYAAVFNQKTLLWESDWSGEKYYEIIEPGAVDSDTDMTDVVLRYNHSSNALILARTGSGTLNLSVDASGIKFDADLAPTNYGKDIYALIQRGDISKMSFAFTVDKEAWESDDVAKENLRRIKHIGKIVDVSAVDFPAYDGTSVTARDAGCIKELKRREEEQRNRLIISTYF